MSPLPPNDMPIAHLDQGRKHGLLEHLISTAALARDFAEPFGAGDWGALAGLWHDLGKYQPAFQQYIASFADPDAHIERHTQKGARQRVDHSTPGALYATQQFNCNRLTYLIAYLIAGHHAGLPDLRDSDAALRPRLDRALKNGVLDKIDLAGLPEALRIEQLPAIRLPGKNREEKERGLHLWVRMLFSCLVDADFLDTEAFMNPDKATRRGGFVSLAKMLEQFDNHMATLAERSPDTLVNRMRAHVLACCRQAAHEAPGRFSLTVPTGGGKTLASLGFALQHAVTHNKRRIIYVIPYTSIIEQTADVFRQVFDGLGEVIVEHHSNAETNEDQETHRTRLACENWDAPLIVTTNVQFFESLFAARTSRCRKLHNIVDSVVILDEAQLLPPEFRQPIFDVLRLLTDHYGVTLLLCTATQPAVGSVTRFNAEVRGLDDLREVIPDPEALHHELRRVRISLPDDLNQPTDWQTLATELVRHPSVLCIVNRRADCRELYQQMPAGTIHLSALMCGAHRAQVIARVKAQLSRGEPTRVISTQLVEAGVDLDFPVVYRALAGLDSIVPPTRNPGLILVAENATRDLLHQFEGDLLAPARFREFFTLFYGDVSGDKADLSTLVYPDHDLAISFRTVAEKFRLIDDAYQGTVFVQYGEEWCELIKTLRNKGPERWLMRKLQRYAVNINRSDLARLLRDGFVEEILPGIFVQHEQEFYDDHLGVLLQPIRRADSLVC